MSTKHSIHSEDPAILAAQQSAGYPDACIAGDTVYLSGVVAYQAEDEDDIVPGLVRAFDRLGATLGRLGLTWDHVVALDTFHIDLGQSPTFIAVKDRYIKAPFPAWTGVGVSHLARPNAIAEIKLTAWKG